MIEELLEWLRTTEGPLPYLALAAGGGSEYVLPLLPGDTVTLFGAFLCTTAGRDPLLVYGAINAGSLVGAMAAYAAGRWLGAHPERIKHPRLRAAIGNAAARFERHGAAYLVVNRFVPALRGVFFVAAGTARLPVWKVLLFGGVSAFLWNALLVGVAAAIGDNWPLLLDVFRRYTQVALALVAAALLVVLWRWRRAPVPEALRYESGRAARPQGGPPPARP